MARKRGTVARALAGVTPDAIGPEPLKTTTVNFRVTPEEKADIERAAASFGLTLTDYLLQLHRVAARNLRRGR